MNPAQQSGLTLTLTAIIVLGMFAVLIFTGTVEGQTISEQALAILAFGLSSENPRQLAFVWLTSLPVSLVGLASAYFRNALPTESRARLLLIGSLALLAPSVWLSPFPVSLGIGLSGISGWQCLRNAKRSPIGMLDPVVGKPKKSTYPS